MTGRTVFLTLPWPPSANKIWRAALGRVLSSKIAVRYKARVAAHLPTGRVDTLTGRLVVWMTLHPPASLAQIWDIANREKCLMDALTAQRVWVDDSQIDALMIVRGKPAGDGCVELMIREVAP